MKWVWIERVVAVICLVILIAWVVGGVVAEHDKMIRSPAPVVNVVEEFAAMLEKADATCGVAPLDVTLKRGPGGSVELGYHCDRPSPIAAKVKVPAPQSKGATVAQGTVAQ